MKTARFAIVIAAIALAACETTGGVATPPPAASVPAIPAGPIDLGNWRNASAPATLTAFEQAVANRYAAGQQLSAVSADLRRNEFTCAAPRPAPDDRGDPATEVCRRTTTVSGCTHTWQVHSFGNAGVITRVRGLYDRRCGNDGLLGGPN